MHALRIHILPPLLMLLGVVAGCSQRPAYPSGPASFPVRGKVTYQGQAAVGFKVLLNPVTPWHGPQFTPAGTTDANGDYQLGSYKLEDGAPVGDYTVTFTWPKSIKSSDDDGSVKIIDQLQDRYADPNKSTFRVTIKEGENELPPFQLK
jgi:hypothetical protein